MLVFRPMKKVQSNYVRKSCMVLGFIMALLITAGCSVAPDSQIQNITTDDSLSAKTVISGQYDVVWTTGNQFFVQNDIWNGSAGAQVLNVDPSTGNFTVQSSSANLSTGGAPMSYASIVKGNHYGTKTPGSGMPIQVSAISSLNSSWSISLASGSYDCAYDIWFNNGAYNGGNYNGAELMIWINHSGAPQPIGSPKGTVNIAGTTWTVWEGNIGWNVISYVRNSGTTSVSFDIKQFINDCVSRGYINTSWNLEAVEAGFELWQGGAGLKSSGFSVAVNGGSSGGGGGGNSSSTSSTSGGGSASVSLNAWQCNANSGGLTIWNGGVGGWDAGEWIQFNNVNLDGGYKYMDFNYASAISGSFDVKMDNVNGSTMTTFIYGSSGGWNTYKTTTCGLNPAQAKGVHTLFIRDNSGAANLGSMRIHN